MKIKMKKIVSIITYILLGGVIGGATADRILTKKANEQLAVQAEAIEKKEEINQMLNRWVTVKIQGKNIEDYFIKKNIKKIAIYGINYIGQTLVRELKDSKVSVEYAIDQYYDGRKIGMNVLSPEDELGEVDAVIVTAITYFEEIQNVIRKKSNVDVIPLDEVLDEMSVSSFH